LVRISRCVAVDFFYLFFLFNISPVMYMYLFGVPIFDQPYVTNHSTEIIFVRAIESC